MSNHLRIFLKRFALIEVGALGFVSSAGALLPFVEWKIWLVTFISISLIGGTFAWLSTKPVHLPEEVFPDAEKVDGKALLEVPTPYHMLVVANKHAQAVYGSDGLALADVEKWWKQNPFVEAVLRSESGDYLGYFDILPLTESGANLVESGKTTEREIPLECILPPTEMRSAKTLYWAGIAVKEAGTEIGKTRTAELIYGLVSYIKHYYGDAPRRVLALATTRQGECLLKGLGARIVCAGEARKDRHNLYEIILIPKSLSQIKSRTIQRVRSVRINLKSTS